MPESRLLQFNPKYFRLRDALSHLPSKKPELVLEPGKDRRKTLPDRAKVYLWESGGTDLVGRGTVVAGLQDREMPEWQRQYSSDPKTAAQIVKRAIIRINTRLEAPLTRAKIQEDTNLRSAPFFRNPKNITGTIFSIDQPGAEALDRLIGARVLQSYGLSDQLPQECADRLAEEELRGEFDPNDDEDSRKRELKAVAARQGQSQFRLNLLEAYGRRCAITECDVEDALEAAHIVPYRNERHHSTSNGLLLRADVHTLFDLGLIAVGSDRRVLVAKRLQNTEFGADLAKRMLRAPESQQATPSLDALERHRRSSKL